VPECSSSQGGVDGGRCYRGDGRSDHVLVAGMLRILLDTGRLLRRHFLGDGM